MAGSRPRVVHLITRLDLGGAQQNTLYCVRHHDRTRFEVGLLAGAGGRLDAEAAAIPEADVRLVPWLRHPIAPVGDPLAILRLARRLRGVDLVHTHSSKAGILGRAAARLAGVRAVVHTVHGWSFNDTQAAPVRAAFAALERAAARGTDRLICVSEADRARGLAAGIGTPEAYRLLRSGIEPERFVPAPGARERTRAALGAGVEDVIVLSVGNLKPQKAPLDFVAAAAAACAADRRLRFAFAGDGELRAAVERAIAERGLQARIALLGWRDDVADLLAASDVFVLTSRFEGLPRAALQAVAAGVPVVLTDTGGTAEIVRDGVSGLLTTPGRPDETAAAILRLAADGLLRAHLADAASRRLGDAFDISRMVRDLEGIYDELLGGRGGTRTPATEASHLGAGGRSH